MTTTISNETFIGDIVRDQPAFARVFESLGIDYCCGGKKPLAEACRERGLDPATVVALLPAMARTGAANDAVDVRGMSLAGLCDHIVKVHHAFLRAELPRLDMLTAKVLEVHGDREPRLAEVRRLIVDFTTLMTAHSQEEEQKVFPLLSSLDNRKDLPALRVELTAMLDKLVAEHTQGGDELDRVQLLTDRYQVPEWGCNTMRELYRSLEKLEHETHQHIHKENNILFPRARAKVAAA